MKIRSIVSIMAAMVCTTLSAKVVLPSAIADGMVLQQQSEVNVWGWGCPGDKVKVTPSWDAAAVSCTVAADSSWKVQVRTPAAGGPYSMTVSDGDKTVISDILIGEVWFCTGQSNMEMELKGREPAGQPVDNSLEEIMHAGKYQDRIRFFQTDNKIASSPCRDVPNGRWEKCNSKNAPEFSAIGYFFAKHLTEALGVPVGIMSNSWGASKIEAWMDEATVSQFNVDDTKETAPQKKNSGIWNHMHSPLTNYVARGFLWYQGEANIRQPELYAEELPAMVSLWRKSWNNPDMAFYYAQIAPFNYGDSDGDALPRFVEMEVASRDLIPHSQIIATGDVGTEYCIHPHQKSVVGFRFAHAALVDTYGHYGEGIPATGPVMQKVERIGTGFKITFDQVISSRTREIQGWEYAYEDGVFHKAEGVRVMKDGEVFVKTDRPKDVKVIQYGYRNFSFTDMQNVYGLPALPFRKVVE